VALADFAGDERRDLVFMAVDRTVHVVTVTGFVPPGWPEGINPLSSRIDPIVGWLGPLAPAVAVGDVTGGVGVRAVDGMQEGWPRDMASSIAAPVTAADVDDDGQVELILPTSDWLWILDMGVALPADARVWSVSGADVGRTGNVEAIPVATTVDATPPPRTRLDVAPNPFNPRTVMRFRLTADATDVALRVFDAKGRLVRTLHDGSLAAGEHAFTWRGRDDEGREVASGVYFGRLVAGGEVDVRSMVLVR
jgi:hypothetical protein